MHVFSSWLLGFVGAYLIGSTILLGYHVGTIRKRVFRLERKADAILKHFGIPWEEMSERVRELAKAGQKIEAIKAFREETGAGLAEAKAVVEAIR